MMAAADSKPRKTSPVLIGAIVALAIVLVVALVVVLVVALVPLKSQQPETNTPVTVVAPSEPSDSASETAPETELESEKAPTAEHNGPGSPIGVTDGNGRALSEKEFYQLLTDYYELAGDYDASVRDAATQFNENFLKEDMSVRKAKASSLKTLKSKIRSSRDELNDIEPPFMSKNTQAYKDICELYECLYRRADVMDQAWTIDLQYDKPKEHEEEIVAPLRAQQVNGNDKYYTRFKELYPNVNIVKP